MYDPNEIFEDRSDQIQAGFHLPRQRDVLSAHPARTALLQVAPAESSLIRNHLDNMFCL